MTLHLNDFDFTLPDSQIAQFPLPERSGSRLLHLDRKTHEITHHASFNALLDFLQPEDLLVLNNTKVIPARLFGEKPTGGKIEVLVERITDDQHCIAHVRSRGKLRIGSVFSLEKSVEVRVIDRVDDLFMLAWEPRHTVAEWLQTLGNIPLPGYIERAVTSEDLDRYQTVYAKHDGAVAAPTAGLHFDEHLLQAIQEKGITCAYVTLHVGAGTFQPVRESSIENHRMHAEYCVVDAQLCEHVRAAKQRGGRVIAVGTTSVRSLETACQNANASEIIRPYRGDTRLFIYPGYRFCCVDGMITNFHLPRSTLLMLVSAFAGREFVLKAYEEAVQQGYRFYSYGDAMIVV